MRRAAAFACGLLCLLGVVSDADAARREPVRPAAKAARKPAIAPKKIPRASEPAAPVLPEFGIAEVLDDPSPGLRGLASFYGYGFQGRRTSTGERFDVRQFTAASNHFPLGTAVAVSRVDNGLCAVVKVNDRMHTKHRRRVIDVSRGVAEYLGMLRAGVVMVRIAALPGGQPGPGGDTCAAAFAPLPECDGCGQPEITREIDWPPVVAGD